MAARMMVDKNFFSHLLPVLSIHYFDRSMFISLKRKAMLIQHHGMRRHYYTHDTTVRLQKTISHSLRHVTRGVNTGS